MNKINDEIIKNKLQPFIQTPPANCGSGIVYVTKQKLRKVHPSLFVLKAKHKTETYIHKKDM